MSRGKSVGYELEDAGAIDGFRVFDDQELFARTQSGDCRSGEGGPTWVMVLLAGVMAVTWLAAGWKGVWKLCRRMRAR